MNFHSQDRDLLMLAHEQLPPLPRLATQVHVVLCPRCRTRLTRMEGASRLLADTIRGRDMHRWRLPTPRGALAAARVTTARLAALVVLLVLATVIAAHTVSMGHHHLVDLDTRPTAAAGGCRPDLPSDKCR